MAAVDFDGEAALASWPPEVTGETIISIFPNLVKGCDQIERFVSHL